MKLDHKLLAKLQWPRGTVKAAGEAGLPKVLLKRWLLQVFLVGREPGRLPELLLHTSGPKSFGDLKKNQTKTLHK